ncbi:MAG: putative lyase [Syntrophorhabdus sp. PtaU1.Bin002]|nr:MAG: putative lyase [Syntrophorhabdus sp. PtaB.Bin006]OPY73584.1 MAG: putative lyase [Syntrophorhabdus sp. PtaU1.Bin002]
MRDAVHRKNTSHRINKRKLADLVQTLRNGDEFEREKAIEYLGSHPSKAVVECVVPLLKETNTAIRMAVLEIIKATGHTHTGAVVGLLEDENEDIRVYACELLGSMKMVDTLPDLIRCLAEENQNVRNAAAVALGEFEDERAVTALLNALHDDQWIVFSAIYSLGKTRHRSAIEPLFDLFRNGEEEISMAACEVLLDFEDPSVPDSVCEILKKWAKKKRDRYIEIIVQKGNEDIFRRLKEKMGQDLFEHLLSYAEQGRKKSLSVLRLMIHFKDIRACDVLLDSLKALDQDEEEYGDVLGLFASLSDVWKDNIQEYMGKGDESVLAIVKSSALAKVKIDEGLLVKVFLDSSEGVKREIIKAVPVITQGDGYVLLKEAVRDKDGHVRSHAAAAIGKMDVKKLKDDVIEMAKADFTDVRISALRTLVSLDRNEALRLLREFVYNGTNEDRKVYLAVAGRLGGEENLPLVQRLFADNDEDAQRMAVSILGGFLEDERYIDIFKTLLTNDSVPHEVLKVIKERKLTQFKDRLVDIFSDTTKGLWTRYYALLALGAFEDVSLFQLFVRGLGDDNNVIKIGSLKALSDLNDARAVIHVRPFVESHDEDIRSTAELVIRSLEDPQRGKITP